MDFRNKYLVATVRIIFGLLMTFSGVTGFLMGPNPENAPPVTVPFNEAFGDSGIFYMIKLTELIAGIMLLIGFLPWLAVIALAPVAVGVTVFNANVLPPFAIVGIVLCLFEIYFGYAYWSKYKQLFVRQL